MPYQKIDKECIFLFFLPFRKKRAETPEVQHQLGELNQSI